MLGLALVSKQNLAEGIKALEKVSPPGPCVHSFFVAIFCQ
jgi:hypothetical protein